MSNAGPYKLVVIGASTGDLHALNVFSYGLSLIFLMKLWLFGISLRVRLEENE